MTASMIQSTSASLSKSSSRFPSVINLVDSWLSTDGGLALVTDFHPASTIRLRTSLSFSVSPAAVSAGVSLFGTMSRISVGMPIPASSAAIPPPIVPPPMTAALRIW
jgi:hypothetical protein